MSFLSPEILSSLADQLTAIAEAIISFRSSGILLTDDQDLQLKKTEMQLLSRASQLTDLSAIEIGEEAVASIDRINKVTQRITATINGLHDIQKVIDITTASVKVAISVISMNPGQITDSVQDLLNSCNINCS